MLIFGSKDARCGAITRGLAAFRAAVRANDKMAVTKRQVVDRCLREAGLSPLSDSEAAVYKIAQPVTPASLQARWNANALNALGVPLQDEFGGDFESFAAFSRHEAAGDVAIFRGARASA